MIHEKFLFPFGPRRELGRTLSGSAELAEALTAEACSPFS